MSRSVSVVSFPAWRSASTSFRDIVALRCLATSQRTGSRAAQLSSLPIASAPLAVPAGDDDDGLGRPARVAAAQVEDLPLPRRFVQRPARASPVPRTSGRRRAETPCHSNHPVLSPFAAGGRNIRVNQPRSPAPPRPCGSPAPSTSPDNTGQAALPSGLTTGQGLDEPRASCHISPRGTLSGSYRSDANRRQHDRPSTVRTAGHAYRCDRARRATRFQD